LPADAMGGEQFMTIMALDVGEKTIGVAFSDETQTLAFPGETIRRQEGHRRDMAELRRLIAERHVGRIVVGLPLMLDGTRGVQAEKIGAFVEVLRRNVRIPIDLQDERLSTVEAERVLIAGGQDRVQRKKTVDSLAACLLLQTYLDRNRATHGREEGENVEADEAGA
jgi:putative Holliday junction resolvase